MLSGIGLLASAGLIIVGHLGTRRYSSVLVDVLGAGEVCLGVINFILIVIGIVTSSCCRMTSDGVRRQRQYLRDATYP